MIGKLRQFLTAGGSRGRIAAVATAGVVLLAAVGFGVYKLVSPSSTAAAKGKPTSSTPAPAATSTSKPKPPATLTTCPLTGLKPPGGKVPQRPIVAVKVGNNPSARPQSGLQHADMVVDTLAEGGITRYIAIYQCNSAPTIGPVRSVRWVDWHYLQQFGHAVLAFVHGINPDVSSVQARSWICDRDAFANPGAYFQNPNRVPPDSTYSSTTALLAGCPHWPAPPPMFGFSPTLPGGSTPASSAQLDYSGAADVVWQWSAAQHAWMHFYLESGALVPDVGSSGAQLHATNVVIEEVTYTYGPYLENPGGTGDIESQTVGQGVAYVLRDGRVIRGTWVRAALGDVTRYLGPHDEVITLQPGNTWVELFPTSDSLTITP